MKENDRQWIGIYCSVSSSHIVDVPRAELRLGPTLDANKIKEGDDVYFECSIDAKPAIYKTSWWFNVSRTSDQLSLGLVNGE